MQKTICDLIYSSAEEIFLNKALILSKHKQKSLFYSPDDSWEMFAWK